MYVYKGVGVGITENIINDGNHFMSKSVLSLYFKIYF